MLQGCELPFNAAGMVLAYEQEKNVQLHEDQKKAICEALDSKICIITGGPGTGKTTITNAIIYLAQQTGIEKIGLVAPTGRAAKRMSESTGLEASTIHRYLKYNPREGFPDFESDDELVICDEASMLDLTLAYNLVRALSPHTRLVFVGDIHQLPSVGAGQVLKDMIESRFIPTVRLTKIFRQSEGSWIPLAADAINRGDVDGINITNRAEDFFWIENNITRFDQQAESIKEMVIDVVGRLLKKDYPPEDIQVLVPMYKGQAGVNALNEGLRAILNPNGAQYTIRGQKYRVGDRILQLKNDYEKEIFNGDQGVIIKINEAEEEVWAQFQDSVILFDFDDMKNVAPAFACTVHRAQGSEFRVVVTVVSGCHYPMLQKNLLYTAVTRAKEICVLIGERRALKTAVTNNRVALRNTCLAERLGS